jgi:GntP family gluconate:H+ symporter
MDNPLLLVFIGMMVVVGGILWLRLHAFIALLLGALTVGILTPVANVKANSAALAAMSVPDRLAKGFGDTCQNIGLVIAMATIIGVCMIETGAAERVVRSMLKTVGERFAPLAFLLSSFLLGIPIFFDTVFLMMVPLAKSMAVRTGKNYVAYILAIVSGGVMAHSLVPPTPGPLQIAHELGVSYMAMTWGGLAVGTVTALSGFLYALWANKRWHIPVRPTPDVSLEDLETLAAKDDTELPKLWISLLPIVLPLILIALSAMVNNSALKESFNPTALGVLAFFGDKNISMTLAAMIAMALFALRAKREKNNFAEKIQDSLFNAGLIILLVGAGGAFGLMLKATNVAVYIKDLSSGAHMALLPLAWFVTTIIRTAQGSATVAMITSAGIVGSLATQGLPFHPVYLALAIGCGSKPFWWMNDSGFWVVCRMSGWDEREMLKLGSIASLIMGVVGLPTTMLLAWLFPFTN